MCDYLTKKGTSESKDRRMAIELALLKETLRSSSATVRWTDGIQSFADMLRKMRVDKTYLCKVLREAEWCFVQYRAAVASKLCRQAQQTVRKANGPRPKKRRSAWRANFEPDTCLRSKRSFELHFITLHMRCRTFRDTKVRECESP